MSIITQILAHIIDPPFQYDGPRIGLKQYCNFYRLVRFFSGVNWSNSANKVRSVLVKQNRCRKIWSFSAFTLNIIPQKYRFRFMISSTSSATCNKWRRKHDFSLIDVLFLWPLFNGQSPVVICTFCFEAITWWILISLLSASVFFYGQKYASDLMRRKVELLASSASNQNLVTLNIWRKDAQVSTVIQPDKSTNESTSVLPISINLLMGSNMTLLAFAWFMTVSPLQ